MPNRLNLAGALLATVSAGVLSVSLANPAHAQMAPLPAGCLPSPPMTGDTVVCLPAGGTIAAPVTTIGIDDLTVVIGDPTTPVTVNGTVSMSAANGQRLQLPNAGSSINAPVGDGATVTVSGGVADLTIASSGDITGAENGIQTRNYGTGATQITTTNVTGTTGVGIGGVNGDNDNTSSTDLTITSTGLVTGAYGGIIAFNNGSGKTTVESASVTGTGSGSAGITAIGRGTDIIVNATGPVSGGGIGISTSNTGTGSTTIIATTATGTNSEGIAAFNNFGTTDLTITATGLVMGGSAGISAISVGSGDLTINTAAVTGKGRQGIYALTFLGKGLSITATGDVNGVRNGIEARKYGTGDLNIQAVNVTATSGLMMKYKMVRPGPGYGGRYATNGIYAKTVGTGDLIVTSTGLVSSDTNGIYTRQNGSGATSITAKDATGTNGAGINAFSGPTGTDLTIAASGDVTGGEGILARNGGLGALRITANNVTGTKGNGINALNQVVEGLYDYKSGLMGIYAAAAIAPSGTDLIVTTTGDVLGNQNGINAVNEGTGLTQISTANVTGTYGVGIQSTNLAGTTEIILGSTATITGGKGAGIFASSVSAGGNITVRGNSGTIVGATDGVDLDTMGAAITVSTIDSITGQAGDGIDAVSNGGDITITDVGTILGTGGNGIFANPTTGAISIQGSGLVGGITGTGMGTFNIGITQFVNGHGILAVTDGNINIGGTSAIGNVTSANATGIGAFANGGGIVIDSSAGSVSGNQHGISAQDVLASVSVRTANVTGTNGSGIIAQGNGGVTVDSSAGSVMAEFTGISAQELGVGNVSVIAANVMSNRSIGISARSNGGSVTVNSSAGAVSSRSEGVSARSIGTGAVSVTTADVTSAGEVGIYATSDGGGIAINSTAGSVSGFTGIYARENTGGSISVTTADVTSIGNHAIITNGGDTAIDSSAGTVTGVGNGISANATGLLSITAANVTGSYSNGIFGRTSGSSLSIDSSAGAVSGARYGIDARNEGTGAATIMVGQVDGLSKDGIRATNGVRANMMGETMVAAAKGGTDLTITATGAVTGADSGIDAHNNGMGFTTITATQVTGTAGNGITAYNGAMTTDLTITTTGAVSGSANGILASNMGTGTTAISSTGAVTGGTTGIAVDAGAGALTLNIGGNVTGGTTGIMTTTQNGTNLTIGSGSTIGGGTTGIATMAQGGSSSSNDVIDNKGIVNGTIVTFEGDDQLTLSSGSVTNGLVMLGAGADILNANGGTFTMLRGGDGSDTLNFNTGAGLLTNSGGDMDGINEFEIFNFNIGGSALAGTHQGLAETNFNVGDHMLTGTLGSTNVAIARGAALQVADGAVINGSLNNMGNLGINAGGLGEFSINGNLAQTADGTLTMDVLNGANFDRIVVTGDVTLDGGLAIRQTDFVLETTTLIDGGTGLFGNFSSVNGLSTGGLLVSQSLQLDRTNSDVNLAVSFASPGTITGLTPNQQAAAVNLVSQLRSGNLTGELYNLGIGIGLIGDAATLSLALEELHPEILTGGIEVFRNSQMLFLRSLLNSNGLLIDDSPIQTASLGSVSLPKPTDGPKLWGSIQYTDYSHDGARNNVSFDTDGFELTAGVSDIEAGRFSLGFAIGYAELDTLSNAAGRDRIQTDFFRLGASARVDLNQSTRGIQAHLDTAIGAAFGSNDAVMNVTIPAVGLNNLQTGKADFDSFSIASRLTFDGSGSKKWPVKPHFLVGFDHVNQEAMTFGVGGPTALNVTGGSFERFTFGYGLTLDQTIGKATKLHLAASGLHHSKETRSLFSSRFTSTNTSAPLFATSGKSIRDQFLGEAGLRHEIGQGWSVSIDGFVEFGDLDGFGGIFKLNRNF